MKMRGEWGSGEEDSYENKLDLKSALELFMHSQLVIE